MPINSREKGKAGERELANKLKDYGYNTRRGQQYNGIPDEADYQVEQKKDVPSWRRVCKSLLRNDFWCKGLSFSQQKSTAYENYLKRMKEQRERENQTDLFEGE